MPTENSTHKNFLWWLASIAISVLCCSVLFVLFAGYLVEIKSEIQDQNLRLDIIEARQKRVLIDVEALREHDVPSVVVTAPAPPAPDATTTPPAAAPLGSSAPDAAMPPVTPPAMTAPTPPPATPDATVPDKK